MSCTPCTGILLKSVAAYWPMNSPFNLTSGSPIVCSTCGSNLNAGYEPCPTCPILVSTCPTAPCETAASGNGYGNDLALEMCSTQGGLPPLPPGTYQIISADATTGALTASDGSDPCTATKTGYYTGTPDSTARTSILALLASVDLGSLEFGQHMILAPPLAAGYVSAGYQQCGGDYSGEIFSGAPIAYGPFAESGGWLSAARAIDGGLIAVCLPFFAAPMPFAVPASSAGAPYWGAVKFSAMIVAETCTCDYTPLFSSCACAPAWWNLFPPFALPDGCTGTPTTTVPAGPMITLEPSAQFSVLTCTWSGGTSVPCGSGSDPTCLITV